ncbi:hypothetical protein HY379_01035 [Candidatus Saccharibacteria bacterium]|nr:hypothetical protein [Candidatus Saccharibacteria bacterium]
MFIVLEGSDGSGKTTQFKLLHERLQAVGHNVDAYDFPRYAETSSYFVKRYLNGEYGPASEISPYTASLFYALDRYEAAPHIRQSLSDKKIVLADRYAGANMVHQGAKFTNLGQQRGFFVWADSLEFQLLGIPRPTINLLLRVPAETSYELIKRRSRRSYTDKSHDEHEADIGHLRAAVSAYENLCRLFPKDFKIVECTKNGKLLPVTEINNRIWEVIKPLLPKPARPGRSAVVSLKEKPLKEQPRDAAAGSQELKDISLLAINNLRGQGFSIDYKLTWPPKPEKARLNFYISPGLPPKLAEKYRSTMNKLISLAGKLDKSLPDTAKKHVKRLVPLAALADAEINSANGSVNQRFLKNLATDLAELRQITKRARAQLKEPQALKQIIKQITETRLGGNSSEFDDPVKLLAAAPRNELDLLADCLYPYSNLARNEIATEIDTWTYEQKAEALKTVCSTDAGSVLKKVHYRFDVIADTAELENLAKRLSAAEIQLQPPTPRYGYQVPDGVDSAGQADSFMECFDLSLELYSAIQAAGFEELAGYAVLRGHRQRWQFSVSGESIVKPGLKQDNGGSILKLLREKIAEAHPLISQSLNQPKSQNRAKEPTQKRSPRRSTGSRKG